MVMDMTYTTDFRAARQNQTQPNRYGGNCAKCNGYVEANGGILGAKSPSGSWTVLHTECPEVSADCPEWEFRDGEPMDVQAQVDPEVGIYIDGDGAIWKVQQNKAKTNVYAKVWADHSGARLTLGGDQVHGEWDYVPGGIRNVRTARRMTLDEAKSFILIYGACVRCGRTLKAAESVERGIGPVCVTYFEQFV